MVGEGALAGRIDEHVAICQDCLQLFLDDPEKYWEPARKGHIGLFLS